MKKVLIALACFIISGTIVFSQTSTANAGLEIPENRYRNSNEGFASQDFRLGVQAFYKGAFNEAILLFEKALSYLPNDNLILEWLGKAYYKSGLEGLALSYWQSASDNGYGGLLLQNKIEVVRERRVTGESKTDFSRLTEFGVFDGNFNGNLVFSGPVSVLPNYDGTMWVAAYNSNEVLLLNQNGQVIDRLTGPINGFDRPADILKLSDGKLVVSEAQGDRLAVLNKHGHFIKYIGEKGRDLGQLVGPTYLAKDSYERIYVSDYGNRRIDVFDSEGEALYFFGTKQNGFDGLKGPTGVCVLDERLFIADDQKGCIYEFDLAGNFIRYLVEEGTFKKPESIKVFNNQLVICDENKIIGIDSDTGALYEYARTGNAPSRVTTANKDINGNLVVSDFTANEIYIMSKLQELVGGFFVQIEQIDASKFPQVTVEVKVENRHRQPVVGLQDVNFYLSENMRPVSNLKFIGAASNNTDADITFIIERSAKSNLYKEEMETVVKEIAASVDAGSIIRIVSAGAIPVTEYVGNKEGLKNFNSDALKNPVSNVVPLDLAIRLATNDLITAAKKRSIIYVSGGETNNLSFENYNLSELTGYLANNCVGFSVVQVNQQGMNRELQYICDNSAGNAYYVFRPEGLKNVIKDIIEEPQGVYQLSYTSSMQTNFGEKYLPVEIEVYLLNRSGRDETGYFAPLE